MEFKPNYIIIHHSATDPRASVEDIRTVHLERGMDDIAYHYLIDSNGEIHIGRSHGIPGAHARGLNQESIGVCCIGDFSITVPTPRILETLISLLSDLRVTYDIPPAHIIGHRDVLRISIDATKTICPGEYLYERLPYLRERSEPPPRKTLLTDVFTQVESSFKSETRITSIQKRQRYFVSIKGTVKNTGKKAWSTSESPLHPIRIGMILFQDTSTGTEVLHEQRYDLPYGHLSPGNEIDFKFEINPSLFSAGFFKVLISPVRERDFWFHQRGCQAAQSEFEIEEKQINEAIVKKDRNIFIPRNSSEVKILVICPTLPYFDRDTGGRRLLKILKLLTASNFSIVFAYEHTGGFDTIEKYQQELEGLNIKVICGPLGLLADSNTDEYSACILGWHECAGRYIDVIQETFPHTKIIVDTVDIHWLREQRGVKSGALSILPEHLAKNKQQEIQVYSKADEVWVVSEEDRIALLQEIPDCSTKIITMLSEPNIQFQSDRVGDAILFVGSFSHPPNEGAALWGYEIVEKLRQKTKQSFTYYIVGSNPPEALKKLHNGIDTIVTGFVEDLQSYYNKSKVFLAPIKYGAGVKGKITDASINGLPIVTNDIGNEGLHLVHGKEAWICQSTDEFVTALEEAFSNQDLRDEISKNGSQKIIQSTGVHGSILPLTTAFLPRPIVISIVTYNKRELVHACIESILKITQYPSYKIAVVSNGCSDGTDQTIEELQNTYPGKIEYFKNKENKYFIIPNNDIIRRFPSSDIVLLNNDTKILTANWLNELQNAAYTSYMVGASGPIILGPDNKVSEFGGGIFQDGKGINLDRGRLESEIIKQFKYTGFVSGCCLFMRRDVIEKYGMLCESLHPMYYEDVEWQYRLHTFRIKTLLTPKTSILHLEGSSAGTNIQSGMKKYQETNRLKFLDMFQGTVLEELAD